MENQTLPEGPYKGYVRVDLYTADDQFVAGVDILPYMKPPEILQWGSRTFVRRVDILIGPKGNVVECYREAFMAHSFTRPEVAGKQPQKGIS